jgi:hypothetical protein
MTEPKEEENPFDTSHIPHGYDDRDFKEIVKQMVKRSEEKRKAQENDGYIPKEITGGL